MKLASEAFSLREVFAETVHVLEVLAQRKKLGLTYSVAKDLPDVLIGDPDRLRQILLNLGENAVKFTEEGSVVLRVRKEWQSSGQIRLHFTVLDTGIGISPTARGPIFEAFVQSDGSATRRHGGAGLGLAISFQLATLMGGRIWVRSRKNRGSTFHFTAQFGLQTPL